MNNKTLVSRIFLLTLMASSIWAIWAIWAISSNFISRRDQRSRGDQLKNQLHQQQTTESCDLQEFKRLPGKFVPNSYKLLVRLSQANTQSYEATVRIELSVNSGTNDPKTMPPNWIVLHAGANLALGSIWYEKRPTPQSILELSQMSDFWMPPLDESALNRVLEVCRDPTNELVAVKFADHIEDTPRARLFLRFANRVSENAKATQQQQQTRCNQTWHLNTQSSRENKARHLFPCFDDPSLKATFELAMIHEQDASTSSKPTNVIPGKFPNNTNLNSIKCSIAGFLLG